MTHLILKWKLQVQDETVCLSSLWTGVSPSPSPLPSHSLSLRREQLMDWGGFETPEEAEAFLAQEDPMVELMKWGGFQTVEEAEVFLADLEA
jgi:hypothetical protein